MKEGHGKGTGMGDGKHVGAVGCSRSSGECEGLSAENLGPRLDAGVADIQVGRTRHAYKKRLS